MWPFSGCTFSDACALAPPPLWSLASLTSLAPFLLLFALLAGLSARHLFPYLSSFSASSTDHSQDDHVLPAHAPAALRAAHDAHTQRSRDGRQKAAQAAFAATVGSAGVLGVLMVLEIWGVVGRETRALVTRVCEPVVLLLVVGVVPWLECLSVVRGAWAGKGSKTWSRVAWTAHGLLYCAWVFAFWSVGRAIPAAATIMEKKAVLDDEDDGLQERLVRGSLTRVGVVGISLMALLAGFASVSTAWYTLGDMASRRRRTRRPVTEADVARKHGGLEATTEMLTTKRHRLAQLERKIAEGRATAKDTRSGAAGMFGMMMGSLTRGSSGLEAEVQSLRVEIAGLETMASTLASGLASLKAQRTAAVRASTPLGRLLLAPTYVFAGYCVYRVLATLLTTLRRASSPSASFASSDPINRFLSLLARHYDPALDQLAWARTISFALSGFILLGSLNSVLQTFRLLSRWMPGVLRALRANLALAVGQVLATYVISAGLLLRSQLPREVGGTVLQRVVLSPAFVDGWFEGWFLVGAAMTGIVLWIGARLAGDDEWDELGMEEMGAKMS